MACCQVSTNAKDPCCDSTADTVRDRVRAGYGEIALTNILGSTSSGGGCCGTQSPDELAASIGYTEDELRRLPEGSNLGLSCGNPAAIAGLRPGQTVLDLGSGAGFDCFLAGPKVGASGRVIGVDMTPEMLARARKNLPQYQSATNLTNVEFRLGEIEHLPVPDAYVDVVISNCVINLSPDKPQVFREIARVLRGSGTLAVSDVVLLQPLPAAIRETLDALIGCVAGAVGVEEYRTMATEAGLVDLTLRTRGDYVSVLQALNDPLYARLQHELPRGRTVNEYLATMELIARKPSAAAT